MVSLEDDTEDMNPTPWPVGTNDQNEPKKKMENGSGFYGEDCLLH